MQNNQRFLKLNTKTIIYNKIFTITRTEFEINKMNLSSINNQNDFSEYCDFLLNEITTTSSNLNDNNLRLIFIQVNNFAALNVYNKSCLTGIKFYLLASGIIV